MNPDELIPLERALALVLEAGVCLDREPIPVSGARGRVLAETVRADRDSPPFDRSAMDGFALRSADAMTPGAVLDLREEVAAGAMPRRPVGPGEASRIFTGAPIPEGADAVQMVEKTETLDAGRKVRILEPVRPGEHIRCQGEETRAGREVMEPGALLDAPEIGYLSWVGKRQISVYRRVRVGILATGDELVEADQEPTGAQIRNSNGPMLSAIVEAAGGIPVYLGISPDDPDRLRTLVEKGFANDLLLVSGGVSVGDRDFVEAVLDELGVELKFRKVAIKPGKPVLFGSRESTLIFGLPGNPASCLVIFHCLVQPLMRKMMGYRKWQAPVIRATLGKPVRRNRHRLSLSQARCELGPAGWTVEPVSSTGSGDLLSCVRANAMIRIPIGEGEIRAGEPVDVYLIEGFAFR